MITEPLSPIGLPAMSTSLQDLLSMLIDQWRAIADETIHRLGEARACLFSELYNDALDIHGVLCQAYPEEERLTSLVFADFHALYKEIPWLLFHFLSGNYPQVYRTLRFLWELLFRAWYTDRYAADHPGEIDVPGPSVDDKHSWLAQAGRQLNWRTVIRSGLERLLPAAEHEQIEGHYRFLWDTFNQCVHPSSELRDRLVGESALFAVDNFDEEWANESLAAAAEVFDLLWLAVLCRFPKCIPLLTGSNAFSTCPRARAVTDSAHGRCS
jgi:hypothetical protein